MCLLAALSVAASNKRCAPLHVHVCVLRCLLRRHVSSVAAAKQRHQHCLCCVAARRCMTRSVIEPSPVRHASLALDAYVQFTSPIRRYSDILAHFNLKVSWRLLCF